MFFWSLPAPIWGFFFALLVFFLGKLILPESDWDNGFGVFCLALPVWLVSTTIVAFIKRSDEGIGSLARDTIEDIKENSAEWIASLFR